MNQQELNKILKQHELWLETEQTCGKRAILKGADLRGANLRYFDLTAADLTGADLRGADLEAADFNFTDLTGAKFDLNFRDASGFTGAIVSKDQLCWLALNPRYSEWADSITVV